MQVRKTYQREIIVRGLPQDSARPNARRVQRKEGRMTKWPLDLILDGERLEETA